MGIMSDDELVDRTARWPLRPAQKAVPSPKL